MAQVLSCPDDYDLKKIALGQLSELDGDSLLQHIEGCSNCAARLSTILAEDTLVEAVRSAETVEHSEEQEAVSRLVWKMRSLVPAARSQDEQTLDEAASTPSPAMSADTNALSWVESADAPENAQDGLAPPQAPDEVGRLGNYRVLKLLGEGGMGKVFLADDPNLQRSVALKVMKPSLARDLDARKRFLQEARLAAAIEHDHIVHIYQVGEDHGIPFFAMQLLKGESLEELLRRFPALKIKDVLHIGLQIAEGLAAAHERGLIHRDIKPGNIWIESVVGGRVKILDFGLARSSDRDISITHLGAILGTPAYMPPEQARGDKVDHRCDLYSLGCVLYRMATGELPLKGNHTMGMLTALAVDEPIAPIELNPAIPSALADLIMKLLAKDPNQRVGSADEVARMLALIEPGDGVLVPGAEQRVAIPHEGSKTLDLYPTIAVSSQASESAVTTHADSNRYRALFRAALWLCGGIFIVVAGMYGIIRIATPEGDYVIDTDDPDFAFSVSKGTVILEDKSRKKTYRVNVVKNKGKGEWELEVKDPDSDLVFSAPTFSIKRNEKVALKAWFQRRGVEVAKAGPVDDAWIKAVSALPPDEQVAAVAAKLKEINPGFAGNVEHKAEKMVVTELALSAIKLTDLSPVRALTGLTTLTCDGAGRGDEVADLSPLKDLPLTSLNVAGTAVSDLSPLKGMNLIYLRCDHTRVKDLSPLKNMQITNLICNFTPVADLAPLANMKLTNLEFRQTQVSDLSPLKDMKLTGLDITGTKVTDLSPLRGLKLTWLNCTKTNVSTLAPLKDLPLTEVTCNETLVANLLPLQRMKLTNLGCRNTKVSDLSPLKGMALKSIECDFQPERDAEILRSINSLERINGKAASIFWKALAGQK